MYPPVRGMKNSLWWFNHNQMEAGSQAEGDDSK